MAEKSRDLLYEFQRKVFHLLSLVYLAAYWVIGYPRVIAWMSVWTVFVAGLEAARLRWPKLNETLTNLFANLSRPEESRHYSGVFHTSAGALAVIVFFGSDPKIVSAALFCAAFGDAAAALIGKSFGKHRLSGGKKSLEGSLGCFLICFLVGRAFGFQIIASIAAATAGTLIEFLPTTAYFNDNLWMPMGTALALRLCGRG